LQEVKIMKIAISAAGKSLDSPFEPRFGRSPGFVIIDTETDQVKYLDNSASQNLPQGAGIQSAQMIMDSGAQVLITGNIGPKASQALENSNLEIFSCEAGTVSEAIQFFKSRHTSSETRSMSIGSRTQEGQSMGKAGRGIGGGGRGMGGGARGRGPGQGGRGMGGGSRGRGPGQGGRGTGKGGGSGMG
jgi:predicted Fe-Mo cluster-binding NifX family protein